MIKNVGEGMGSEELGSASRKYESGGKGVHTISSGKGDRGGVSYGKHQLSSKAGTMAEFLKSPEGSQYAGHFGKHKPGSRGFNNVYSRIAESDPHGFADAQHAFIKRTHYDPIEVNANGCG